MGFFDRLKEAKCFFLFCINIEQCYYGSMLKFCQSAKMERVKKRSEIGGGKMGEYRKKYDEDFKKMAAKNLPNH